MAENEEGVESLLDALADAVLVVDENEKVVSYNKSFEELWDIPRAPRKLARNQDLLEIGKLRVKDPTKLMGGVSEISEKPGEEHFLVIELKNGKVLERFSRPRFISGKFRGRVISFRDVTGRVAAERELRKSEQLLRESEQLLRYVFESSPVGILVTDGRGRWMKANPTILRMLGYSESDLVGKPTEMLTHPEDRPATHELLGLLRAGEIPSYQIRKRYLCKDGTSIWVEVFAALGERDAAGFARFGVVIVVDMSGSKRAEEEREKLLEQARAAVRIRDEFIAVASHELRTPVTPLKLQVQMLSRQLRSAGFSGLKGVSDLLKLLATSETQLEHLNQLIDQMLDASRLSARKLEIESRETDLSELVQRVIERNREELKASGSALVLKAPPGIVGCWDPLRLEQLISHLLVNAIKYGRGNSIELTVFREGNLARLIVRDHGVGIAREDQEKIFHQFERVSPIGEYGGFGLGLYIARQIVLAHGGLIRVESEPGRGAEFVVDLPLQEKTR